ncbi:hypothetical protein MTR67_052517, partial [Solanum verrucosum]
MQYPYPHQFHWYLRNLQTPDLQYLLFLHQRSLGK